MIVYYNDETFDASKFGEESIVRQSQIATQQVSELKPTFFQF